jgi:hypothetical protein
MRLHTITVAFLAILLMAPAASADGPPVPDRGAEIALRAGFAIPFGESANGTNFDQYASSAIPFLLEAGLRVSASLFLGVRGGYAFPQLKNPNNSCTNASCDGSVVTLGLEGIYRFNPLETFAPWVGVGGGYEWAGVDRTAPNISAGATLKGFQGLLMVGGDYRVNQHLVIGPVVELAFGRFDSIETRGQLGNISTSMETDITDTSWHQWLTLGVRGAFGF